MNKKAIIIVSTIIGISIFWGYNKWFVKCADFSTQAEAQEHMNSYGAYRKTVKLVNV